MREGFPPTFFTHTGSSFCISSVVFFACSCQPSAFHSRCAKPHLPIFRLYITYYLIIFVKILPQCTTLSK